MRILLADYLPQVRSALRLFLEYQITPWVADKEGFMVVKTGELLKKEVLVRR